MDVFSPRLILTIHLLPSSFYIAELTTTTQGYPGDNPHW